MPTGGIGALTAVEALGPGRSGGALAKAMASIMVGAVGRGGEGKKVALLVN